MDSSVKLLIDSKYELTFPEDAIFTDNPLILQKLDNVILGDEFAVFSPVFPLTRELSNILLFPLLSQNISSNTFINVPFTPRPLTASNPNTIDPFATTIPINEIAITHLTQWQLQVGQLFGQETSSSPDFNGILTINSDVSTEIKENRIFSVEQRGQYVQLATVRDKRTVTTTETIPLTILGQHIQMSLTGGCVFPDKPMDAICSYTPGVSIDPNSINPKTLLPTRTNSSSNFGEIVTPESLEAIRQPGFQRGANGQEIGIDFFLPNTGTVQSNEQASQSTITRHEDFKNAAAASYLYTYQIAQTNAEKSVMARTIRGIPFIQDETNTILNPALSLVNAFLPDIKPTLEPSDTNAPVNKTVNRNLYFAANNLRLPASSFVIYQAGLGEAYHPAKNLTDVSQLPPGYFNSIWLGLSPVINRRQDTIEGGYSIIGPTRILANKGGEGGNSSVSNVDFTSTVNGNAFSSLSLTDPYTQIYIKFFSNEANVTFTNIYSEETHYYPHLSFTGNITNSNSVFRYYGGIIAANEVKPYIGLDYAQNFPNWSYQLGAVGYLNADRDYYSQLNGRASYRIPLNKDILFTLFSGISYALQKDTRIGDTINVTPLSSFATGFQLKSSSIGFGVTNFLGLDNLENNSLSKMLVNLFLNFNQYATFSAYFAPYDDNPNRTQYGLDFNLNLGREFNSPQLSFSWANYQYRYFQNAFGNSRSVYDNIFKITLRIGQPNNPFRKPNSQTQKE
ncbi:MAG: hypothetical protein VKJ02_10790 [Snowella sp.]|nr:hypothetical protein [Snowella sp.]